jgi:hypothetical protein
MESPHVARLLRVVPSVVLVESRLVAALREGGMSEVPERFSVAPLHQEIPRAVLVEMEEFIRVFDRVTTGEPWQQGVTAAGPEISRSKRPETCFFSAWDFHIPPDRPHEWRLIEFNDNGSGFMFAALLNRAYYEVSGIGQRRPIEAPIAASLFAERLSGMMRAEAESFFGGPLCGLVLVVDDDVSLEKGRFRQELVLLRDLCRGVGWDSEIASPAEAAWDGNRLLYRREPVGFVVNRSTDFWWEGNAFSGLRSAYASRSVYVAPNPFTYSTRSDKRLLEWLSSPVRDMELGIRPEEREILTAHVPETRVLCDGNVDGLARSRGDWFFKPSHGFASHGLLAGSQVGRTRLRRLLKKGQSYVAQRRAPKFRLETRDGVSLWADLRVWAYRGERFLLSGRASRQPDCLDLSAPGGWLPTYALAT